MIKILVVDDEPFIRQGLNILIDWKQYGYEIVGEASNGLEAIEELKEKEVDLIITDIKMPEMNGIELIEYVRSNISTKIKFVVLSGYYEFEYAKKAIKYNVTEYILKPIQREELIKVLCSFREEYIVHENEKALQKIKDKVVYDRYLNEIIYGRCDNSTLKYVRSYLKPSEELRYIIFEINYYGEDCINISDDEKRKGQQILYQRLISILGKDYYNVIEDVSKLEDCYDIGFIYDKKLAKELNLKEKEYISKLQMDLRQGQKYDFCIFIGQKVSNIKELAVSYKTAIVAKLFSDFSNKNNISYYDEISEKREINFSVEKRYMDNLIHEIEENNEEAIKLCVDKIYSTFKERKMGLEIIKVNINYLLCSLINIAKQFDSEADQEEVIKYISSIYFEQIASRGSAKHLKSFAVEFARYLKQLRQNSAQGILNYVEREISEHYMEKLSLKYLSEKYYINSAYLGQVFKKKYNVSFKDYLNSYRIEKAAELLKRSSDKIYSIAEKVGYNNPDYFINKFVQIKQKTPMQYRKEFFQ